MKDTVYTFEIECDFLGGFTSNRWNFTVDLN